jgi:hypothetical protein
MKECYRNRYVPTVPTSASFCTLYQAFVLGGKMNVKNSKNKVQNLSTVSTVSTRAIAGRLAGR